MTDKLHKVRLDRWLWAARFYKTRSLAVDAIKHGHIMVNELKAKPAKQIGIGEVLRIRKAQLVYIVFVSGLSERRLGAEPAQKLYTETPDSIDARAQRLQEIKAERQTYIKGRPSKKERRLQLAAKRDLANL